MRHQKWHTYVELRSRLGQAALDGMGNGPVEYLKNIRINENAVVSFVNLLGHIKAIMNSLSRGNWSGHRTKWWWSEVITSVILIKQDIFAGFTHCPIITAFLGDSS